jgi:hypothetical protein
MVLELAAACDDRKALAYGIEVGKVVGVGSGDKVLRCNGFLHVVKLDKGQLDTRCSIGVRAVTRV